ncbi:MAG: HDOD domain-containing protein [Ketobacteraceae bacterium]|nr:HDOD domain-containing protein [Ketobacteraceae bacterium]
MPDNEDDQKDSREVKKDLGYWVDVLSEQKMPALASTVNKMSKLTTDEDSRVSQLSEEVLKDPNLTSRVLQVANSVIYRGVAGSCATITRAIVLMGFTTIRDISLSMKILDEMLKKSPSVHLKNVLAKSFHAAMQAKGIVSDKKFGMKEEVFIAGLLHHIGEMSILSRGDETARELDRMIQSGVAPNQASKQLLGVSFDDLARGIADQWQLSPVLVESLSRPEKPTRPAQAVLLGEELSQVAALGWDSDEVARVMKKIADFTKQDTKEALEQAKQIADYAKEISSMYGADQVKHLIPPSNYTSKTAEQLKVVRFVEPEEPAEVSETGEIIVAPREQHTLVELDITPEMIEAALNYQPLAEVATETRAPAASEEASKEKTETQPALEVSSGKSELSTDATLQLDYMSRIGDLLMGRNPDVNEIFRVILDGMHHAVQLDRVIMCLVTKDRKKLIPRSFRGEVADGFLNGFGFSLREDNAFSFALRQVQPLWLGSDRMKGRGYLVTEPLRQHLQTDRFFVAPIVVSRRPIGIFYGDMKLSGRDLSEQQFVNFNSLAQQASIALTSKD